MGRGYCVDSHADQCLFLAHYPRGVKVAVHLPVATRPKRDYTRAAITNFIIHREEVMKGSVPCRTCECALEEVTSSDCTMLDVSDDLTASDDEEVINDVLGLDPDRRAKRRQTFASCVRVGESERARLAAKGIAGYLNDSIIILALEKLCKRGNSCGNSDVRAVPSTSYAVNNSKDTLSTYMEGKEWPSTLLIPVNVGGIHWAMFVLSHDTHSVEYWDSMSSPSDDDPHDPEAEAAYERSFQALHRQLSDRLGECEDVDSDWVYTRKRNLPRQRDAFNCGVWLLLYAECIIRGDTDFSEIQISPNDLVDVRSRIWSLCEHTEDDGSLLRK
jgi:hypothetical protein